jgi:NitT/TauT family transport system permease protein
MEKKKNTWWLVLPYIGAAAVLLNYYLVPEDTIFTKTNVLPIVVVAILVAYSFRWITLRFRNIDKFDKFAGDAPKLFAALLFVMLWDILTVKTGILPMPYFQEVSRILGAFIRDWQPLIKNVLYSLRLLFLGYACGLGVGFATGLFVGWFPRARYWVMPVVKLIGPIPATVWIPIIIILVPSMFAGSVVLIAFGVWFPATLMTATGIMSVPSSYLEVARTLGASQRYLLLRVALPSALPNIFMGAFMGMSISCVTLLSAEMLGSTAGLGWYINTATAWAEWNRVYAGIILILLTFFCVITLLFKINKHLAKWQKDQIQW